MVYNLQVVRHNRVAGDKALLIKLRIHDKAAVIIILHRARREALR